MNVTHVYLNVCMLFLIFIILVSIYVTSILIFVCSLQNRSGVEYCNMLYLVYRPIDINEILDIDYLIALPVGDKGVNTETIGKALYIFSTRPIPTYYSFAEVARPTRDPTWHRKQKRGEGEKRKKRKKKKKRRRRIN